MSSIAVYLFLNTAVRESLMITRRHMLGLLAASPLLATSAHAGSARIYVRDGYAIGGYDPVAYFVKHAPSLGTRDHMLMWRGAIWRFETAASQAMFERDPVRYAPRYGGYCAYSLSRGMLASTDPDAWAVHDGCLYLTRSAWALEMWSQDKPAHVGKADDHWPAILLTDG